MLSIDVFVSDYKPIATPAPGWTVAERATWPATTATLISGEREACLVDALATEAEARRLVEWIRAKGKVLTSVYITHGHGDHFFGLPVVLAAFPGAKAVTLPEIVPHAREQLDDGYLAYWRSLFPDQVAAELVVPSALDVDVIPVDGHEIRPMAVGQSDTSPSSVVHVPELAAVVGGDIAYEGIHLWLAQTDGAARRRWLAALDLVEALEPRILVAGHRDPSAPGDDPAAVIAATRRYLTDFDAVLSTSSGPDEVITAMTAAHGGRGNPYTLFVSAHAQYVAGVSTES